MRNTKYIGFLENCPSDFGYRFCLPNSVADDTTAQGCRTARAVHLQSRAASLPLSVLKSRPILLVVCVSSTVARCQHMTHLRGISSSLCFFSVLSCGTCSPDKCNLLLQSVMTSCEPVHDLLTYPKSQRTVERGAVEMVYGLCVTVFHIVK